MLEGFRSIVREPSLRFLIGLFTAQTFVAGLLAVYTVVLAIEPLDLGNAGVGYLESRARRGSDSRRRARILTNRSSAA